MADLFTDIARDVEKDLPRCPRGAIIKALSDSWRDFCRRAMVWRPVVVLDRVAGQKMYPVNITSNADVVQVDKVRWRTPDEVTADDRGLVLSLTQYSIHRDSAGRLCLALALPPPDSVTGGLTVHVVLSPKRDETNVEDEDLFLRYQDGIIGGALFDLASKPRRPWSSQTIAARGRVDFMNAVSQGLADRVKNFAPGFGLVMQ